MTAIVGVVAPNGSVWIGGDSCASSGEDSLIVTARDPKVFNLGPRLAVGCAGDWLWQDLFHKIQVPKSPSEQWLRRTLPTAIRSELQAIGVGVSYTDDDSGVDGSALIGCLGSLWWLETPDLVTICYGEAYAACGGGSEVALGALHATRHQKDPRRRCRIALEAAANHVAGVGPPFVLVSAA